MEVDPGLITNNLYVFDVSDIFFLLFVLKYIFIPGIYLWIYIVALIVSFRRKNFGAVAIIALTAGYYATMFFGPKVQLRYIFPVMSTVPFLILITTGKSKENE